MAAAAAADGAGKKAPNPEADCKNWEQRLRSEQEAPTKWNEAWGSLFDNGVPHEQVARIKHYEQVLTTRPLLAMPSKYGVGAAFKEPNIYNNKRKKMFGEAADAEFDV
ncbi:hypothetical protein B484DRAFT_443414 [Ochromonadaceae sp. CCMP2298]|nr:hypothetical protein B484DRAFT_443414 [Ochromonadaceae sp. CCMP2298]|mmetsp:Transcript_30931/g.68311  ORF Transcript_30931/g.68311 Transcript_30931/m.68311 type:complete len:108 (+) Transcript_30931:115-438(+)|eukprot:CAMPEP_0173192062 /NCGR_PEP_ID=MMETSP1141-20130122/13222_1 /TAXON_ID=483371 /ORGANISM="non described non described, Strain CCMP2298" /LENGTH=107 /DNA_ID=CAMNT_0014116301 /DNA_START=89 /DNA_END=412 /DNA_ORIENTATION=+